MFDQFKESESTETETKLGEQMQTNLLIREGYDCQEISITISWQSETVYLCQSTEVISVVFGQLRTRTANRDANISASNDSNPIFLGHNSETIFISACCSV